MYALVFNNSHFGPAVASRKVVLVPTERYLACTTRAQYLRSILRHRVLIDYRPSRSYQSPSASTLVLLISNSTSTNSQTFFPSKQNCYLTSVRQFGICFRLFSGPLHRAYGFFDLLSGKRAFVIGAPTPRFRHGPSSVIINKL